MPGHSRFRGRRADGTPKWQARWRHPATHDRREKTFPTKRLAELWIKKMDSEAWQGTYIDPRKGETRYSVVADAWRESWVALEPKTRAGYESLLVTHLLPEFETARVSAITHERVERYLRKLSDGGMAAGTVRSIYAALRASLNTAVRLRMISANPCVGVKLPRAPEHEMTFLTAEEVRAVAETINPHFRVLVYTAAYTGIRAGELHALRRRDVDLLRGRLLVERSLADLSGSRLPEAERKLTFGSTKNHSKRSVSLPRFLRALLDTHLAEAVGPDADALVFTSLNGEPIRQTNFYRRYFKAAVLGDPDNPDPAKRRAPALSPDKQGVRFHDLRHTCAAFLIASGAHAKVIQAQLGHKSITMTLDRYGHLMPGLADAAAEALDATHTAGLAAPTNLRELHPAADG